ncbi:MULTISPECIES: CusA/CzcA family heavy metal efflux RND transporter [unclassified Pseudoalteromonas]|uniref:efflux RND transporter permease subunit n=1 Tax=unclassified Pseudoalteromonas TaxID=194690 RepID=UPI002096ECA4|nr:CusA/CzcA family heavy metal efflux RND transporter [Pseudoalteromonas sp. XMcav2-N]MCO7190452.1 CusA/CzcA family heavy metal efflux RND transporter [Pseudoalteromonas sp. XMcav2-N]
MLDKIIKGTITHRALVLFVALIILTGALWQIPRLNLDAFPDVTNVQVTVNTEAPGLAAQEVEQLITYPIEAVMYALPDVEQVRSVSKTGLSGVTVVFKEGTDIYFARQLVFERLQAARSLIPDSVGTPDMGPNTSGLGQVYQYLLVAEPGSGFDEMALRGINDWVVKLLLMPVEGVTDVLSFGGQVKQYQVDLDPARLLAYKLTQAQVQQALTDNNRNVGGWYLDRGQEQLVIRGVGWFASGEPGLAQIRQVPVKTENGTVVRVSDIAQVKLGGEIRQGAVTMTQRDHTGKHQPLGEVVSGIVLKRMGANTKATIDGINEKVAQINRALPPGVKFVPFYDQSMLIDKAVSTVTQALLLAFVFIAVVLIFFLFNLRAAILVILSVPAAIILALGLMSVVGMSANLMSLGGLAVAIGMLVDGSVVMVERILQRQSCQLVPSGEKSWRFHELVTSAAMDVARPIFFASTIILLVFLPLFSFEGVEAKLFVPMAISIMLVMVCAVVIALLVVPPLACYLLKSRKPGQRNAMLAKVEEYYRQLLTQAQRYGKALFMVISALFVIAIYTLGQIGTEFVPELEEGTLNLRVTLAPSASLETALSVAPKLEQTLLEFEEVTYALSRIGRPEVGGDPEPVNNIEIYIGLRPVDQWKNADTREALQEKMAVALAVHPGLLFNFSQPIATRVDELLSGVKAQLAIKLLGPDLTVLMKKGEELEHLVQSVNGTVDVALEQLSGEAQLVITPDREALSRFGLSVSDVMELVSSGLGGNTAGQVVKGNERYDIYVRLTEPARRNPAVIESLRLLSPSGAWVSLKEVANVEFASGPVQIRRDDVQRRIVVQANVSGRDMGSVVEDIRAKIDGALSLPPGYSVELGGQFESQQRAYKRLALVIPCALLLMTLLLFVTFNSAGQAALVMMSIPLGVIGGVFSLYWSGQYLSVPASVGFITLFGVAVLNAVVLVESINRRIASGEELSTAIQEGAASRLRPVLMTALTSALGLMPILLSSGVGSEVQKPLASVVIGGLITSTLLTLFVLPILFERFSTKSVTREAG